MPPHFWGGYTIVCVPSDTFLMRQASLIQELRAQAARFGGYKDHQSSDAAAVNCRRLCRNRIHPLPEREFPGGGAQPENPSSPDAYRGRVPAGHSEGQVEPGRWTTTEPSD